MKNIPINTFIVFSGKTLTMSLQTSLNVLHNVYFQKMECNFNIVCTLITINRPENSKNTVTVHRNYMKTSTDMDLGLHCAHPVVSEWFIKRFESPTEPQIQGCSHILAGNTTLISAPTGSGKTLAAFWYALAKDVQKNLTGPLTEILELAKKMA